MIIFVSVSVTNIQSKFSVFRRLISSNSLFTKPLLIFQHPIYLLFSFLLLFTFSVSFKFFSFDNSGLIVTKATYTLTKPPIISAACHGIVPKFFLGPIEKKIMFQIFSSGGARQAQYSGPEKHIQMALLAINNLSKLTGGIEICHTNFTSL